MVAGSRFFFILIGFFILSVVSMESGYLFGFHVPKIDIRTENCFYLYLVDCARSEDLDTLTVSSKELDEDYVYMAVENMPFWPDCEKSSKEAWLIKGCTQNKLLNYIMNEVKYPAPDRIARKQGQVVVQFTITRLGKVENPRILKAPGGGIGKAAMDVVMKMNDSITWIPANLNGKNVSVLYTVPIKFELSTAGHYNSNTKLYVVNDSMIGEFRNISHASLDPMSIERIKELSSKESKLKYGDRGRNGAYIILLKKEVGYPSDQINRLDGSSNSKKFYLNGNSSSINEIFNLKNIDIKFINVSVYKDNFRNYKGDLIENETESILVETDNRHLNLSFEQKSVNKESMVSYDDLCRKFNIFSGKVVYDGKAKAALLQLQGLREGSVFINIIDKDGEIVKIMEFSAFNGRLNNGVDLSSLSSGDFYITANQKGRSYSYKILKD
jgi:TonB family protein